MATEIYLGSKEFIAHNVMVNGVAAAASAYVYADVPANLKVITEAMWLSDQTTLGTEIGHMVGPGTPFSTSPKGERDVFVRVTDSPEIPIRKVGSYELITF